MRGEAGGINPVTFAPLLFSLSLIACSVYARRGPKKMKHAASPTYFSNWFLEKLIIHMPCKVHTRFACGALSSARLSRI